MATLQSKAESSFCKYSGNMVPATFWVSWLRNVSDDIAAIVSAFDLAVVFASTLASELQLITDHFRKKMVGVFHASCCGRSASIRRTRTCS